MLDHHIQRTIVNTLKDVNELSFSELKPQDIENKLFTYHLKIVIREGFVEKIDSGYGLTPAGRRLWKRMSESAESISLRPYSVLFFIIRHKTYGWLLYRRKTHPVKDRVAFMHGVANGSEHIVDTASKTVFEKTGLTASFTVIGSGYFHTFNGDELDGFTNFTVLLCDDAVGKLSPQDEHAEYFWAQKPDFSHPDMLPNMKLLAAAYFAGNYPFFIDEFVSL